MHTKHARLMQRKRSGRIGTTQSLDMARQRM